MSAYVISDLEVQDEAQLQDYVRLVPPLIEKYGGRYVARRGRVEKLEGTWSPKAVVIVEFPTPGQAKAWYACAEYQEIRARYFKGAARNRILVEGV